MKGLHLPCKPTPRMLRYWWGRLNRECFEGMLKPCQLRVADCSGHGAVGLTWPLESGLVRIDVHPEFGTRAGFISTVAHEMIHQYQHQNGLPLNHGREFDRWKTFITMTTGLDP